MSYTSSSNPSTLLVSTENTGLSWYATADGYNQSDIQTITLSSLAAGKSYSYFIDLTAEEAYIVGILSVNLTYEQNEIDCSEGEQKISPTLAICYLMSDDQSLVISYTDSSDEYYDLAQEWLTNDGTTITYSITEDESNGDLEINSSTGVVTYNGSGTTCTESVTVTVTGTCSDGLNGSLTDGCNISVVDNTVYYTVTMECYDQDSESLSGCSMYYRTSSSGSYTTYSSSFTVAENTTVYYYATLENYSCTATSSSPAKVKITENTTIKIYLTYIPYIACESLSEIELSYGGDDSWDYVQYLTDVHSASGCAVEFDRGYVVLVEGIFTTTDTISSMNTSNSMIQHGYNSSESSSEWLPIILTSTSSTGSSGSIMDLNSYIGASYGRVVAYTCTVETSDNDDGTTHYEYTCVYVTVSQALSITNTTGTKAVTLSADNLTGLEYSKGNVIYNYDQ